MPAPIWQGGTLYPTGSLVQPVSSPAPVPTAVTNAGFESGDTGWTKGTGWTINASGAYQGTWALVASVSMGSALFFSGVLRDALSWRAAWGIYAGIALIAGLAFLVMRRSERPGGG